MARIVPVQPANVFGGMNQGYEMGRKQAGERMLTNHLAGGGSLSDPQAINALSAISPELGVNTRLSQDRMAQQADQFEKSFGLQEQQFDYRKQQDAAEAEARRRAEARAAAEAAARRRSEAEAARAQGFGRLVGVALSLPEDQRGQAWPALRQRAIERGAPPEVIPEQMPDEASLRLIYADLMEEVWEPPAQADPKRYNVGGALVDAEGNVVYQAPTPPPGQTPPNFDDEQKLRKELDGLTKEERGQFAALERIEAVYDRIQEDPEGKAGLGDVAILFSYMKMLDPGSVVREGEFATAQQATGVPDSIVNLYNHVVGDGKLTPAQRAEIVGLARTLGEASAQSWSRRADRFRDIARASNLDPNRVAIYPGPDRSREVPKRASPAMRGAPGMAGPSAGPASITPGSRPSPPIAGQPVGLPPARGASPAIDGAAQPVGRPASRVPAIPPRGAPMPPPPGRARPALPDGIPPEATQSRTQDINIPPPGVPPELWAVMTIEERLEWMR